MEVGTAHLNSACRVKLTMLNAHARLIVISPINAFFLCGIYVGCQIHRHQRGCKIWLLAAYFAQ